MFRKLTEKKIGKKIEATVHLVCDICNNDIVKVVQRSQARALMSSSRHFCNHKCYGESRKKGGRSYLETQKTCLAKYNVTHHMKSKDFIERFQDIIEEKYGARNVSQTDEGRLILAERMNRPENKEKFRQNWIENNPAKRPEVKIKLVESLKNWAISTHGVENAAQVPEIYKKGRQSCLEKYGDEHPIRVLEYKRQETCLRIYGSTNPLNSKYVMDKLMYEKWGMSWDERNACLSEYEKYTREVWKITNKQNLKSLPDYDLRGKDYHLDHKFSIAEGFRQGISPEIIGSIVNLQILPSKDNIKKSDDCSVNKDELLTNYMKCKND